MIAVRPSREAVALWNAAYSEQTAAMFAAMRAAGGDVAAVRRLALSYLNLAQAWRVLSADLAVPLWARTAASIAAEEFERRARMENCRANATDPQTRRLHAVVMTVARPALWQPLRTLIQGRKACFTQSRKGVMVNWHSYYTNGPNKRRRKAISASCGLHRGPVGLPISW